MLKLNTNQVPLETSFKTPASLYRGAPFWSWNGDLQKEELLRQLDVFEEMGIGGYHIHPRTGLSTGYLGDNYMALVKACVEYGRQKQMLTWLYDEDRWPSGSAGGLVTKDHRYRSRKLRFTCRPYGTVQAPRQEDGELLATYAIALEQGCLKGSRLLRNGEAARAGETTWYAYLEVGANDSWFNNQAYIDTLNPEAVRRFIEVTHERYKAVIGAAFGSDVPAIFTDEPQFTHKRSLRFSDSRQPDAVFPWTPELDVAIEKAFGESMLAHFPEVIWDLPEGQASLWRYRYHEWVAERFAASFADQIGRWCAGNRIALTGHMMEEPTLGSQTNALGDAMRSYRSMQIPGIDMLCDWEELNTAKQAQSAARQFGAPGVLSELYGVTGWHFDFNGYKRQGDWQAALGVLFRVHHLSWYCMRGEAKRDYPASISYQSPWYKEYKAVEDHFARVGAVLSRGKPLCRVAVIHPIESYWLCAGPLDTSADERALRDERFTHLTEWLLHGLIDFDFVSESLLPGQADRSKGKTFGVGEMQYEVVVVPGLRTMRSTTLERLEAFAAAGGRILFAGEIPTLVDAVLSDRVTVLAGRCERLGFERVEILEALRAQREVDFVNSLAQRPASCLYQLRAEGDTRYLFLCNTKRAMYEGALSGKLILRGEYRVTALDTADGSLREIAADYANGETRLEACLQAADHLLLRLTPGRQTEGGSLLPRVRAEVGRLTSPVALSLSEPNVLLFEKAAYRINDGAWQPETQLLDIENVLRAQLGIPAVGGQIAQPWVDSSPVVELATVSLRIRFDARVNVAGAQLALENLEESRVSFDGQPVAMKSVGYFTDKAIATIALPAITAGAHTIEIQLSFTKKTSIEWVYLLGDFGVTIEGLHGVVTAPVRTLSFGDWTLQGLPFYGGNVTYHCKAPVTGDAVQLPQFKGTAVKVCSQGQAGVIYRAPYQAEIPVKAGEAVDITVFGHRANCFGPIHLAEPGLVWLGPDSYRTKGTLFSPEFQLRPLGIMSAPIVYA